MKFSESNDYGSLVILFSMSISRKRSRRSLNFDSRIACLIILLRAIKIWHSSPFGVEKVCRLDHVPNPRDGPKGDQKFYPRLIHD